MVEPKTLISDYLRTLSGQSKTQERISRYVDDPKLTQHILDVEAAFPRYELIAEDLLCDGNKVVLRGKFKGVHRGAFADVQPTGKTVTAGLMIIYAVQNGRIVDHWMQFDTFGLMEQLRASAIAQPAAGSAV